MTGPSRAGPPRACARLPATTRERQATVDLVHELTFRATLGESLPIGAGPSGQRAVAIVTGGVATGDRIRGTLVGPGADWVVIGADGYGQIDVRAQIRTDDGVHILVTYTGSLELNEKVMGSFAGGETSFDDQYFRTHIRMECGDERYAWVNRTLFVGRGRMTGDGVEYEVYRLA